MEKEDIKKSAIVAQWRDGAYRSSRTHTVDDLELASHGDYSMIEKVFLFDSVGLSAFSHKLDENNELVFRRALQDGDPSDAFRMAVLEGRVTYTRDTHGDAPLYWDQQGNETPQGALRQNKRAPLAFAELKDVFLGQLRAAIDGGAEVILAGEFGCPTSAVKAENDAFMAEIREIISKVTRPVFLVAGSRHTPSKPKVDEPYNANVAMVFGGDPGHPDFQSSVATQPRPHFKRAPSITLKERIFSPADEKLPYYITPFCNFGVLVCSDALDTQILYSFLSQNPVRHRRIQVILVPAFNQSPLLYDSCRYLSYLANATVVVLNSASERFPEPALKVFTCGFDMDEFSTCLNKRTDAFGDMPEDERLKIIKSIDSDGKVNVKTAAGTDRDVAFYNVDRVMLETFSDRLAELGGPLLGCAMSFPERGA